ncbi:hypothetical protein, partial [Nocardia seriolae]|uniref:hypothetical protein n=1 Tax=Nocardia seriolae TaxID=37332 RepID=UPI0031CE21C8
DQFERLALRFIRHTRRRLLTRAHWPLLQLQELVSFSAYIRESSRSLLRLVTVAMTAVPKAAPMGVRKAAMIRSGDVVGGV